MSLPAVGAAVPVTKSLIRNPWRGIVKLKLIEAMILFPFRNSQAEKSIHSPPLGGAGSEHVVISPVIPFTKSN
jgi:hypothetical protein